MGIQAILPNVNLPNLNGVQPPAAKTNPTTTTQAPASFSQMLASLRRTQNERDALMAKLAAGEEVELHQVMIAAEETDISFRVAMAIRDKLVEAYQETMRMAV